MTKTALFRYVPRPCTKRPENSCCPVTEGAQFSARLDGNDIYRAYQSTSAKHPEAPYIGSWFAACLWCLSHKLVEKVEE